MYIRPFKVARALGWIISVLVICSLIGSFAAHVLGHGRLLGFRSEFNLNTENNVPTYFSSALLLTASALLFVIVYAQTSASRYRWHWAGLAVIFLFFSLDETASFHERLTEPMRLLVDAGGLVYFTWVIPGIAFVLVFSLIYLRFWFALPSPTRRHFALAGVIYVAGAAGLELIGGGQMDRHGGDNLTYELITTIEETLELTGTAIFIYALLVYIGRHISSVSFQVDPK